VHYRIQGFLAFWAAPLDQHVLNDDFPFDDGWRLTPSLLRWDLFVLEIRFHILKQLETMFSYRQRLTSRYSSDQQDYVEHD